MPPRRHSRYTFTFGLTDEAGRFYLTDREPYTYRAIADTKQHIVKEGETLHTIAAANYRAISARPDGLWWAIADFQPTPILDPTIALTPGSVLHVPSARTVAEEVLSEKRRKDASP